MKTSTGVAAYFVLGFSALALTVFLMTGCGGPASNKSGDKCYKYNDKYWLPCDGERFHAERIYADGAHCDIIVLVDKVTNQEYVLMNGSHGPVLVDKRPLTPEKTK